MPIILWKYKTWIAIAVLFIFWLCQIAYTNYLSEKLKAADAACIERINKVNGAYQSAIDAWRAKVFIVENELEPSAITSKLNFEI